MSSTHHDVHYVPGTKHIIPHHFSSANHEFEASKFGLWLFLVTEVLLFGGLFCAYAIFRGLHYETYIKAHEYLDWKMGGLNTIVLLTSSLTMALGVGFAQRNERSKSLQMLVITFLCGAAFMVVKYFEYTHKFHEGIFWAGKYTFEGIEGGHPGLFFSIYFMATGLHGVHVLVGMGLIAWVMKRTARGDFTDKYYTPVELTGLYWHLVDLIWIFLFPLFYLIG